MTPNGRDRRKRELITLVVVFTGVLLVSALLVYFLVRQQQTASVSSTESPTVAASPRESLERSPTPERRADDRSVTDRLFGTSGVEGYRPESPWTENVGRITLRLVLPALLAAALAFRPRKRILVLKRNPYVSQTQILLAIVASALMIVVGDNAARAFGIFAAVSLVRFRTNIRDPKEITVLLISLALGLAAGVGRYELALILVVFTLIVLAILEWKEPSQVFRSMIVKVATRNAGATQRALRQVFKKYGFDSELRGLEYEKDEASTGSLVYSVDVSPLVSTDQLSEDIFSLDEQNIESIEWDQKKSYSYLYQ